MCRQYARQLVMTIHPSRFARLPTEVPSPAPTFRSCAQDERNACLAAATRADALLARLGQHAMLTRGVD